MSDLNKGFYAIIPANVRYDSEIPPNAKLLYSEITALCNVKGYCWPTNDYFAELYNVSERTISRWISKLIQKEYIVAEYQYKAGTKEILKRYIKLAGHTESVVSEFACLGGDKNVNRYRQNCHLGGDKNVRENNINNNNIIINNYSPSDEEPAHQEALPAKDIYETITDLYSKICTKLPKVVKLTDIRRKAIKKLLEMYTIEQIETAFKNINESNFCTGNNDRGWKADFDFCINTNKITNALEGKYINSFNSNQNQSYQQPKVKPANKFHNFIPGDRQTESDMEALAEKRKERLLNDIAAKRGEQTRV